MRPIKHASALLQCAYRLFSEGKMCDTTLHVDGHTLHVHRLVLVAYSSYFAAQGKDTPGVFFLDLAREKKAFINSI